MKATPILITLSACICTACGHKRLQPSPATDTVIAAVEEAPAKEPVSYTLGTQPAFDKNFSQKQLKVLYNELNRRYQKLDDPKLQANLYMWGMRANTIEVYFIHNTPEARKAFKEKLMDSPAIRFNGPEEPVPNAQTYTSDTLGIEYIPTEEESLINCLETRPEFPGGDKKMLAYIQKELRYPEDAWKSGIQGRVRVQVTITKEGKLTEPKVVRSVDPRLDEEAVRVVMSMPRWKPGLMRSKPVEVKYVIPVAFRLKTE